jgi:hypothetical protein
MPLLNGRKKMTEQEAKRIYNHQLSLAKVFKLDVREKCREKGIPSKLIEKFIKEDEAFDKNLSKFDWDGNPKK